MDMTLNDLASAYLSSLISHSAAIYPQPKLQSYASA